jgi:hypothetical protein
VESGVEVSSDFVGVSSTLSSDDELKFSESSVDVVSVFVISEF